MIARVAASEHALLSVARALVGQVSPDGIAPVLRRSNPVGQLRATSMRLLKETLARGVVLELVRRGGWRSGRFLKNGNPVAGRVWERHAPPALHFTAASFELCRWLTTAPLGTTQLPALKVAGPLSAADELLLYLAADLLVRARLGHVLRQVPLFHRSGFVWLGFLPFVLDEAAPPLPPLDSMLSGEGAIILEALQHDLAGRWVRGERSRRKLPTCEAIRQWCGYEEAVLAAFLGACERAGRRDLAGFLIQAGRALFSGQPTAASWFGLGDTSASLRERAAARQASGVFLRHLGTLHRWAVEARHTAFFEDHYPAAQAYMAQWALLGDECFARGEAILRELEALDFDAAPSPGDR